MSRPLMRAGSEDRLAALDDLHAIEPVRKAFDEAKHQCELAMMQVHSPAVGAALKVLLQSLCDVDHDDLSGGVEALADRERDDAR